MIVDTSAIMTVLLDEPEEAAFATVMLSASKLKLSAGSWIELAAVLTRRGDRRLETALQTLISMLAIEIVPVSLEQAELGHQAYRIYGRGTKHRANLNFGDCFAYALAKATGEPLLFKGDDFAATDIVPALNPLS